MKQKVLLIDDQAYIRNILSEMVEYTGYSATTLESAEEALYLLEYEDYQVIITDLTMPWMDGAEFCRKVKKLRPESKVYALSGNLDDYDPIALIKAGFNGLYEKPMDFAVLKEMLDDAFFNDKLKSVEKDYTLAEQPAKSPGLPADVR